MLLVLYYSQQQPFGSLIQVFFSGLSNWYAVSGPTDVTTSGENGMGAGPAMRQIMLGVDVQADKGSHTNEKYFASLQNVPNNRWPTGGHILHTAPHEGQAGFRTHLAVHFSHSSSERTSMTAALTANTTAQTAESERWVVVWMVLPAHSYQSPHGSWRQDGSGLHIKVRVTDLVSFQKNNNVHALGTNS